MLSALTLKSFSLKTDSSPAAIAKKKRGEGPETLPSSNFNRCNFLYALVAEPLKAFANESHFGKLLFVRQLRQLGRESFRIGLELLGATTAAEIDLFSLVVD